MEKCSRCGQNAIILREIMIIGYARNMEEIAIGNPFGDIKLCEKCSWQFDRIFGAFLESNNENRMGKINERNINSI